MDKDIPNRLKKLREVLNLNQKDFAKRIKLGQSTWGMIEVGERNFNERHLKLICSEFNVNEEWLMNGKGEMFNEKDDGILTQLAAEYNFDEFDIKLIKLYGDLNESQKNTFKDFLKRLFDQGTEDEIAATSDNYIERELESYRRELEAEQKGRMLSASEKERRNVG